MSLAFKQPPDIVMNNIVRAERQVNLSRDAIYHWYAQVIRLQGKDWAKPNVAQYLKLMRQYRIMLKFWKEELEYWLNY